MTEIEERILRNQALIMYALWESLELSDCTMQNLNVYYSSTLKMIREEKEKREREQHGYTDL